MQSLYYTLAAVEQIPLGDSDLRGGGKWGKNGGKKVKVLFFIDKKLARSISLFN